MKKQLFSLKQAITLVLLIIINWICIKYLDDMMTFIEIKDNPLNSPPWYFILNDLRDSIAASIGFTLSLLLILFTYRKFDVYKLMLLFISFVWYCNDLGNGISILRNTKNVFNSKEATTNWATLDQYLNSAWNSYIYYIFLILLLGIFFFLYRRIKKINASKQ
jgi:hypothetical protein